MQKFNKLFIGLAIISLSINTVNARTTILSETLLSQESFNAFTAVSVTGVHTWYFNAQYGAVCSGYAAGQSYENEDWLISPSMNLSAIDNVKLTFDHTRGNAAVMNVGVAEGWYKAFATANYTGDPTTTQWIELEGVNQNLPGVWQFVSSGELLIPATAISETSRIAFRYISSATQSSTWEVKNVVVTGEPEVLNPSDGGVFKITNWNTEWLGCMANGPADENLQLNNVAAAIQTMNSDIYCLQELSNTNVIPNLLSVLGNEWGGNMVRSGNCEQLTGIIYKKLKVQFVNSSELSNGSFAQGNSYSYNWANGRYPALYNVHLTVGNSLVPVSLVNIHAKAEMGQSMDYIRRKGGAEGLKGILDNNNYNTKNVIIVGDFNDYLLGTTSSACGCTDSPYKNFVDDETSYKGITKDIINIDTYWETRPIIENIIISNELFDKYVIGSAAQEAAVVQSINNFKYTTSDHLPVSALFNISIEGSGFENVKYADNLLKIYPNPAKDEIIIEKVPVDNVQFLILDLAGKQLINGKLTNSKSINVSALPAGVYILKIGDWKGKFVKE